MFGACCSAGDVRLTEFGGGIILERFSRITFLEQNTMFISEKDMVTVILKNQII